MIHRVDGEEIEEIIGGLIIGNLIIGDLIRLEFIGGGLYRDLISTLDSKSCCSVIFEIKSLRLIG
jgi:hypothetical protein